MIPYFYSKNAEKETFKCVSMATGDSSALRFDFLYNLKGQNLERLLVPHHRSRMNLEANKIRNVFSRQLMHLNAI